MSHKKTLLLTVILVAVWIFTLGLWTHPMSPAMWVVAVAALVVEAGIFWVLARDMWRATRPTSKGGQ